MRDEPPAAVLSAFGADVPPAPLAGGQGKTFRAGNLVFKRAGFEPEAKLRGELFERLDGPGFRVPRPVRTREGRFVHSAGFGGNPAAPVGRGYRDAWCAWRYVDGAHAGPNGGRWRETLAACRAFHAALAAEPGDRWRAVFRLRTDAWSAADRLTFGEATETPLPAFAPLIGKLTALLEPVEGPDQLVHGDFTANVLFAEGEAPCVIDFSPYWRPAPFALGVVVADAVAWAAADPTISDLCADIPNFEQWSLRGLLRRVWECDQHTRRGRDLRLHVAEYERAAAALFG